MARLVGGLFFVVITGFYIFMLGVEVTR